MKKELYLKIPEIEELSYRKEMLSDPYTMEYNKGYDLFNGYNRETRLYRF